MTISSVAEKYYEFIQLDLPRSFGWRNVGGICTPYLESTQSGIISTYLYDNNQTILLENYILLQSNNRELMDMLPKLKNQEVFVYFYLLYEICSIIEKEAKIR